MCAKRKHVGSQSVPLSIISDCQPPFIRQSHVDEEEAFITERLNLTYTAGLLWKRMPRNVWD